MSDLRLFLRNLWLNKLYSAVTVLGFSLALMLVILLSAYIRQELSYDQFHVNKDRIYRAVTNLGSTFAPPIGERLKNRYPEVEAYSRLYPYTGYVENQMNEKFSCQASLVDSSFLRMFSFRLLDGNPQEALRTKNSAVVTESFALKIFGKTDVIGQSFKLDDKDIMVTGILENVPTNTHFDSFDLLLRFDYLPQLWGTSDDFLQEEGNSSFGLYLMAKEGADLPSKAEEILRYFKEDYWMFRDKYATDFGFEPLISAYWSKKTGQGAHTNSWNFIVILIAIVIVILILAFINYTNLSVARAGFRAKEAAIKKLVGISNGALFRQFIRESVLLCFLSFLLAIIFSFLAVPLFNQILGAELDLKGLFSGINAVVIVAGVILLGMISGFVPAFMIMRFNPVEVVKGSFRKKARGVYGKILICFQYAVTITLIICTLVIFRQTKYLQNYDLGFDRENVIRLQNRVYGSQKESLRSEFMKLPEVTMVSFAAGDPTDGGNNSSFIYNGKTVSFQTFKVDSFFFKMMDIHVTPTGAAKYGGGIYLNRTAVKELELGDLPVEFNYWDQKFPVVGITDDFHFDELTQKVGPAMIFPLQENWPWSILVKINSRNPGETFNQIKTIYSDYINGLPFESGFMDTTINQWYEQQERTARLIAWFATVSIILAMMGILAMATYYIQQRVKEIGVRRVNGASIPEVLKMLVSNFMVWVLVAFIIACPVAWYAMNNWLQNFPYRIGINPLIFIAVGLLVALGALLMVGWQSFKAATENPVHSLKSE